MEETKDWIKTRIEEFWDEHRDFDDRKPRHVYEAERVLKEIFVKLLYSGYDEFSARRLIIEAIEELHSEAEEAVKDARRRFYNEVQRIQSEK